MTKKEFKTILEPSAISPEEAEARLEMALSLLLNLDLYEEQNSIPKAI